MTAPVKKKSAESKDKFVLFMDIMGFKDKVQKLSIDALRKEMLSFKSEWNNVLSPFKDLSHVQFSDSILVVTKDCASESFNKITQAGIRIMQASMKHNWAIKGAIAKGSMVFDKNNETYCGQALIDAYLLEEQMYYYGIVAHHTVENEIEHYKKYKVYEERPLPFKTGKFKHYDLRWYLLDLTLQNNEIKDKAKEWLSNIRKQVSDKPRVYIDHTEELFA